MGDSTGTEWSGLEIAVIGMAGRFPGASNIEEFWGNLCAGVEGVSFFSEEEGLAAGVDPALLKAPNYVNAAAVLDGIELFDAHFFGFNPREAEVIDPQQRLFLECAVTALEHAGYAPGGLIGVYAGVGKNTYVLNNLLTNGALLASVGGFQAEIANDKDFLATRVSYKLNLEGPSLTVQTACSTSLVAVHLACQGLLSGDCHIALAGGVRITVPQKAGYFYQEGGILSPDGHCRAYDAGARGTVSGNGVGIVVLKRLEDALADGDTIHAIIKGSAINNDGGHKAGYTAPRVDGQAKAIRSAQLMAQVDAETIGYIEGHGTGTPLGDPIELAALTQVFAAQTDKKGFCAIGSVKTNIGHLDAASGVAGLIKAVLALEHKLLPPSLHFEQPNPSFDFANSPFYVAARLREWHVERGPRRAGVSSFGIGGTNAHVVLEEAPSLPFSEPARPWQVLTLSAKTASALETMTDNLAAYLRGNSPNLADIAYTLQIGRRAFEHRRMLVCRDLNDALGALQTRDPERIFTHDQDLVDRSVVFLFPGQGSQYVNMGLELYQAEPAFRETVDRCAELLRPHLGLDLREVLYPKEQSTKNKEQKTDHHNPVRRPLRGHLTDDPGEEQNGQSPISNLQSPRESGGKGTGENGQSPISNLQSPLNQTQYAQPALFVVEYGLARLWMSWGVRPQAMIGHSIGEYVAACLAGVFSLEDALKLVAARGRLMQSLPAGAMLAISLSEDALRPLLNEHLSLAASNAPSLCVVSGALEAIEQLQDQLAQSGIEHRRLHTSHAFHSPMMEPILAPFTQQVRAIELQPPQIAYISNLTGTWITPAQATDPNYWARQLRQPVRFTEGLEQIAADPDRILLEVGPGRTLSMLARQHPDVAAERMVLSSLRHPHDRSSDVAFLQQTVGRLWLAGVAIDWPQLYSHERRRRVPLPSYPFERQRYWIGPLDVGARVALGVEHETAMPIAATHARPGLKNAYVAPSNDVEQTLADVWQRCLGIQQVGAHDNFFELGGHSLLATQIMAQVRNAFQIELPLHVLFERSTIAGMAMAIVQLNGKAVPATRPRSIPRRSPAGEPQLSFAQQRLWFLDQLEPGAVAYHIPIAVSITGRLDVSALEQSLNEIARRHEVLRTTFSTSSDGHPVLVVAAPAQRTFPIVELGTLSAPEQQRAVQRLIAESAQQPFDLAHGPLWRASLLRLGDQEHVVLLVFHHIIFDGWSEGVLIRELVALYNAFSAGGNAALPELPIQYIDYAAWQREWLQGDVLARQMGYWKQQLAGELPVLELPLDHPRPAAQSFRGKQQPLVFPRELVSDLHALSREIGVTPFMLLLAAFKVLLYRYTGQEDILVGTPVAGRGSPDTEDLIGFFVNTLVLRTKLTGTLSFRELLAGVRDTVLAAQEHQDVPFERLVDELQPERKLSHAPLFQAMFVFRVPMPPLDLPDLRLQRLDVDTGSAQCDLSLRISSEVEGVGDFIEYNTDLFDAPTIARMADHLRTLLEGIVANPDCRISALPLLTPADLQTLATWNATLVAQPEAGYVHQLFAAQAARTPDDVAVRFFSRLSEKGEFEGQAPSRIPFHHELGATNQPFRTISNSEAYEERRWTYQELNRRANQLAHHLRALGVGPDVCVGLCMERSPELILGVLGILKAGGAYVPLDPAYPHERLQYMLEKAEVAVLLTTEEQSTTDRKGVLHTPPANDERAYSTTPPANSGQPTVIDLIAEWETIARQPATNPDNGVTADNLAYLIYTSGSTGEPKGVAMRHGPLANLLAWQARNSALASGSITLQFAPVSFDVSFQEIGATLCTGGTLLVIAEETRQDMAALLRLLAKERVNRLFLPFIALQHLAEVATTQNIIPEGLREVITAGEQLQTTRPIIALFEKLGDCRLENQYGPSESHVVTAFRLDGPPRDWAALPPIGQPIANTQIHILDRSLHPVPIGVAGELYIGGDCLARGYQGRPDLTAERFVPNPFAQGRLEIRDWRLNGADATISNLQSPISNRLYRTGDRARYRPDGTIEFLGRVDQQVKVRGFRIELGEIETILGQHPAIQDVVAVVREDLSGHKRLVAYVVPGQEQRTTQRVPDKEQNGETPDAQFSILNSQFSIQELRDYLKTRLPEYMIPAAFVTLEALPLTPSGKIDRRALPEPDGNRLAPGAVFVAPRGYVEGQLARIWSEVLGIQRVGTRDNFFELGGDSILSIQIIARANRAGIHLTPKDLFQHQTIDELAAVAGIARAVRADQEPVVGPAPLTPIQHWFFEQQLPAPHHWNMALMLEAGRPIDPALLERAVGELLVHHDALRLRFVPDATGWQQAHGAVDGPTPFERVDLSGTPVAEQRAALEELAASFQVSLNLEQGPVLRVVWFDLGAAQPGRILIIAHHLVIDGVSWRILLEDLQAAYQQLAAGERVQLPPKTTSYRYWAERLLEHTPAGALDRERQYWLAQLQQGVPRLPRDHSAPQQANIWASNRQVSVSLDAQETLALLRTVPETYNTQINDVLLTALVQAFAPWTGSSTLLVSLEGHGREQLFEDVDVSRTVGWFTSIFPVLLHVGAYAEPGAALKTVKEQLRAIPNRGVGYGRLRYLCRDAEFAAAPQAEVSFNYLGQLDQVLVEESPFGPAAESVGPLTSPHGVRFAVLYIEGSVFQGQLHIRFNYSEALHHHSTIELLSQRYVEALRALIRHCQSPNVGGYTPSDFRRTPLSQKDLDRVIARMGKAATKAVE